MLQSRARQWHNATAWRAHTAVPQAVVQPLLSAPRRHRLPCDRCIAVHAGPATQPVVPQVFYEGGGGDPILAKFQEHQKTAARPEAVDLARTWMTMTKHGVVATVDGDSGFPTTSVVEFVADGQGKPVFAVSTRSPHTADMAANGRIGFTVTSPAFASLSDGRVSFQGTLRAVTDEEKPALREAFLKKHPNAFYIDFGDFKWFILHDIRSVRVNGGFAMATTLTGEEYTAGRPDPVAAFSAPVCGHMNKDHEADTLAMVRHYTGLVDAEGVKLLDLDRLGMNAEVTRQGQKFKLRLPFPRPAEDRKSIKDLIVEMTKAGRAALEPAAPAS